MAWPLSCLRIATIWQASHRLECKAGEQRLEKGSHGIVLFSQLSDADAAFSDKPNFIALQRQSPVCMQTAADTVEVP